MAAPAFLTSVLSALTSAAPWAYFRSTDATALTTQLLAVSVAFCWGAQVTTGEWSWVDRLWSLSPAAYALLFAACNADNARVCLMAVLASVWAARLTANFARKGGYTGEEDYRWAIIRKWFATHDRSHPLGEQVFSFVFVALYQQVLIWGFVVPPCYVVLAAGSTPLGSTDFLLAGAFLLALLLEAVTDEQQWAFQRLKHSLSPAQRKLLGGDYARGFCSTGVFAASRHLNFFCEQTMWWVFYGFTVAAGAPAVNWSVAGALLLSALFAGSTTMTEAVTRSKYPAYAAYQRTTSVLIPWLPGTPLDSHEGRVLVDAAMAAVEGGKAAPVGIEETVGVKRSSRSSGGSPGPRARRAPSVGRFSK